MNTVTRLLAATCLAATLSVPAWATPSRAELDARTQILESRALSTEARLNELEDVLLTGDPAAVLLANRLDAMEATVKRLTGDLEKAQFENRQLTDEVATLRREVELLDRQRGFGFGTSGLTEPRTRTVLPDGTVVFEGGTPAETDPQFFGNDPNAAAKAANVGTLGSNPAVILPSDPQQAIDYAKRLLVQGRFDEAEEAFARFAVQFPSSPDVGEALFWQAETFFLRDAFGAAKDLYVESLRKAPEGPKAPDAMVKLAASLTNLNERDRACATLQTMRQKFPSPNVAIRQQANREAQRAECAL